jgi:hypothetical protein
MAEATLIQALSEQRYSQFSLPQTAFEPLILLGGSSKTELGYVADLKDLLQPGAPLPEIRRDVEAPDFSDRLSKKVNRALGVNLLGSVLKAFGGNAAGIAAAYDRADTFAYFYSNVLHDFVLPYHLGKALTEKTLVPGEIDRLKSGYPLLYVVTDTLKSNKFGVVAYDEKNGKFELKADAIASVVGADVSISGSSGADSALSYSGEKYLRFGFRAMQLAADAKEGAKLIIEHTFLIARAFAPVPGEARLPDEAYAELTPGEEITISGL